MSGPKLVLRDTPPLTDVPGWLEDLAKKIRAGELVAEMAVVVLADRHGRIDPRQYGNCERAAHSVGLLKMAADYVSRVSTHLCNDAPSPPPKASA